MFDLDAVLAETVRIGASDLHLKVPAVPRVRVAGQLIELPKAPPFESADAEAVRELVLSSEVKRRQFEEIGSTDLSFYAGEARFRVALFSQRGIPSFVFRVIPSAPRVEGLGLPDVVASWADAKRGLLVVTGPTGCGKSTTNAAILDLINRRRSCSILTIEDPIEFIHSDQKAAVCQREIGLDAPSYHTALRAALRQDPDVIMIGEVRDEETAMTALRAAETGHLVLCTMHTLDAVETVKRFIDLFGERQAPLVRQVLASTFVGICSQRLIPAAGGGLLLNVEVLINSARMQDLIVQGAPDSELRSAIAEGDYYGMCTFDQSLIRLVVDGAIDEGTATDVSANPHDFKLMLADAMAGNGAVVG